MTVSEYNQCVDQYADGVFRFILKNIRDEDAARDVVQDAFTKMWEKHEGVEGKKAKSYLFTAAYHTMIDFIRRDKKFHGSDVELDRQQSYEHGYSDLQEVLHEALDTLPEKQKAVLLLRDYEGYSYKEIGAIVDLNESQVKVYIYRARVAMKKYIGSMEMVI
jgi:RNA polymerase sigma-70 factor (ECF subfamily)